MIFKVKLFHAELVNKQSKSSAIYKTYSQIGIVFMCFIYSVFCSRVLINFEFLDMVQNWFSLGLDLV